MLRVYALLDSRLTAKLRWVLSPAATSSDTGGDREPCKNNATLTVWQLSRKVMGLQLGFCVPV